MKYVDLRSDTVTQPTPDMRRAMAEAEVGDDVYLDDPTILELERLAAATLGKEAALFVPTGTMGNQLAIMTHTRRGDEIIAGANSHIVVHEVGAAAILSGVSTRTVSNPNDYIYPHDVRGALRSDDIHEPPTRLLCLENALSNGRVMPIDLMMRLYATAKDAGLMVHLDGARIFNAAASLGVAARDLAACADSVMFCVSKGLCAPVGSLLCGSREFVARARKNRKILGGGMRQAGVLAAAGIIAVERMTKRLHEDHENARYLAKLMAELPYMELDPESVEINMVFFTVTKPGFDSDLFVDFMFQNGVKITGAQSESEAGPVFRFVTNNDVTPYDIDYVARLLHEYLE
ncbi:GntG family PLP-dependent aldolase [Feifania hominis]|uniref:Threonine aldolase n=1 Tax=Feifania hominis TaxID=2763660 RepID=A0A926DC40_9FIRM|nr:threonine aldolase [Feifania hominis]